MWSASWRWWKGRPRLAVGFAAPHVGRLPGVWRVDASWESQTFRSDIPTALGARLDQSHTHGALTVSDWLAPSVRYSASAGIDSWSGAQSVGRTIFAGGSLERRWLDGRWSLAGAATAWMPAMPARGGSAFHKAGIRTTFRSSVLTEGWVYLADAGVERASDNAPLAIWPGAGEGRARDPLLRAHPLLDGGAIDLDRPSVFGRTVLYTHAEAQRWLTSAAPVRFGIAAFVDMAGASRRLSSSNRDSAQIDLGAGLRVAIPGAAGMLRIDVAHGLRDGANAMSFGWQF